MKNSRIGTTVIDDAGRDRPEVGLEEALQRREPDRQRQPVLRVEHQGRPQEVVPRRHECEDSDCGERWSDDREQDRPPDPPLPCPVDARGVDQVVRNAAEGLAQQEDVERADEAREDQGRQRVVVVEDVDREHEARDVGELGRHDQRREQRVEDRVTTEESHLRERIRRHRGYENVQQPDCDRDDDAVQEEARDRQRVETCWYAARLGLLGMNCGGIE